MKTIFVIRDPAFTIPLFLIFLISVVVMVVLNWTNPVRSAVPPAPAPSMTSTCSDPFLAVAVSVDGKPVLCIPAREMSDALISGISSKQQAGPTVIYRVNLRKADVCR